jgi:hypothetical protein
MDLCHVSLKSHGSESLRDFTRSSRIHATSPLDLSVHIHFGSSGFDNLRSQLKPHYSLPRALDLLTSVPVQIDDSRLFGYSGFGCFNLSPFPSFGSHDPPTRILLDLTVQIRSGPSALRTSEISSFKLASSWTHGI